MTTETPNPKWDDLIKTARRAVESKTHHGPRTDHPDQRPTIIEHNDNRDDHSPTGAAGHNPMTTETPTPKWDDLIKYKGSAGLDDLPDAPSPYYFGAKDGLFLHRRMMLGRGAVKMQYWPDQFDKFGADKGVFDFDAPIIPGALMSQVVDFFRRTYRARHAEAAVLLTFNEETKEWGVYIPTQLVSHSGVNYVYDPTTIKRPRYVVGSIHSHCDFSPFHSGTDTGDADNFDGLHMTIGYIEREKPGIVAMMAMNKVLMDYKEADFPFVFDYEALGTATAPAWWDQYVGNETEKPVGYELYKKFEKPTAIKTESKPYMPPKTTWQPKPTVAKGQHGLIPYGQYGMNPDFGWFASENRAAKPTVLNESAAFNRRNAAERGLQWHKDGSLDLEQLGLRVTDVTDEELKLLQEIAKGSDDPDEYNDIPDAIADAFFDDQMNVMTDMDEEWAMLNREEAKDIENWQRIMLRKLYNTMMICRDLGLSVSIKTDDSGVVDALLPGGPIMSEDHIHKGAN
jgi:hypothetical protein